MYFASSDSRSERIGEFLPGIHAHDRRARTRDERSVGRCGDLRHLSEQLDIARRVIEMIVADETAVGLTAELAILLFVQLLEDRALIPRRALVLLQRLAQLLLGDVHDANLQHLVGFGIADEIMQPAPSALDLLETLVVQDDVDLLGQLLIDLGDDRLDRPHDVVGNDRGLAQRLLGERAHRALDFNARTIRLRFELFLQQRGELICIRGNLSLCGLFGFSHVSTPSRK
jgi:hypothetical protein